MEDAKQRAEVAAAHFRDNPEVMERVDAVIESMPPCSATYTLRLLAHADDQRQAALENREECNEEFFATLRTLLQSQAFKEATNASAPGNTRVLAAGVLSVFDGAWRAALEARQ
ncbi:hypothetical protein COHA_007331 [Chlorella ohadii]|uniref:Uncharacterized protein n=1 Tax=Chlorella ohadii TaxID=2649997 RepID=A0AAD5H4C7_9CHLO|nr:hypothetical protein COHA_007331 [Chlorella ohadii]